MKSGILKKILNLLTFAIFGFAVYALRADILATLKNIKNADYFVLALIPFLQYFNYNSTGQIYKWLYKIFNVGVPNKQALSLALELNFIGFVLPTAGVSGLSYLAIRMKDKALPSVSTTVMGVKILIQNLAFIVFLFSGLLMLSLSGQASNFLILVASSLSLMIVFGGLVAIYIISSKARIRNSTKWLIDLVNFIFIKLKHFKGKLAKRISSKKIEKKVTSLVDSEKMLTRLAKLHDNYLLLKRNRKQLIRPFAFGMLANLTELATIYLVFGASGYWANPGAIIIGYAVASAAGIFSVVPGGVGIYEFLMVSVMVSAGVPAGVSISAIVMYRIINSGLSLPVGYYFYHKQLNKNSKLKIKPSDAN